MLCVRCVVGGVWVVLFLGCLGCLVFVVLCVLFCGG